MRCALTALTVFVLLGAGCGSATKAPEAAGSLASATAAGSTVKPAPGQAELIAAVKAYSRACLGDHPRAAWRLLSRRLRDRTSFAAYRAIVREISERWGTAQLKTIKVMHLGDGMARVTYRFTDPAIDQVEEPWVVEGGRWRYDD